MNSKPKFEHIESFLTLLFAVSVFVWKPGIYVSSGLITAYLLTRSAIDRDYARMVWNHPIAKASLAMFVLGLITSTIGAEQFEDIAWMARKTLFLPAVIFFVFALESQRNRKLAMAGLIGSFWIASLLALNSYDWQLNFGGRMEGHWPQGTWDSLLGLFFPFMLLSLNWKERTNMQRFTFTVTALMALLMLILAGGRATWIGALSSLAIYFFVFKLSKRVFLISLATSLLVTVLGTTIFNEKFNPVIDRFASITDTKNEGSAWIRLELWKIGITHLQDFAANDHAQLLFGGGSESYDQKQVEFFKNIPYSESARAKLAEYGYPTGDTHNTYIDNALRHGVIWTIAMFAYLFWLCTRFSLRFVTVNPAPLAMLINLSIVGVFYTAWPHFMTFFFALFIALLTVVNEPAKQSSISSQGDKSVDSRFLH